MIRDIMKRRERESEIVPQNPVAALQSRMNELFRDFWGLEPWRETETELFMPRVDVTEDDKAVTVTAELPGLDEKNINLELQRDSLVISGEKREEHEEKHKDYHRRECSYGSFQRVVPLPAEIDENKISAEFKKGVLTITLPKTAQAESQRKKIEIKKG